MWDVRTGQALSEPLRHDGEVQFAAFSPDGQRVLTALNDGTAWVWDLPTGVTGEGLADVAEALARWRVGNQGQPEVVPFEQARQALDVARRRAESGKDELARWLRWLLADPALRTISPNSAITFEEYIARLVEEAYRKQFAASRPPRSDQCYGPCSDGVIMPEARGANELGSSWRRSGLSQPQGFAVCPRGSGSSRTTRTDSRQAGEARGSGGGVNKSYRGPCTRNKRCSAQSVARQPCRRLPRHRAA